MTRRRVPVIASPSATRAGSPRPESLEVALRGLETRQEAILPVRHGQVCLGDEQERAGLTKAQGKLNTGIRLGDIPHRAPVQYQPGIDTRNSVLELLDRLVLANQHALILD